VTVGIKIIVLLFTCNHNPCYATCIPRVVDLQVFISLLQLLYSKSQTANYTTDMSNVP